MNEKYYETEKVHKIFLKVAIPSIFAMIFSSIGMIIDGLFVGNYIGSEALAAVNLVMPVFMIIFALSDLIAVGSSVKVSMYLGEKRYEKANSTFSAVILIVSMLGITLLFLGSMFSENIIYFFIKDSVLADLALRYTMPYVKLLPFIILFYMTDNFLRICGKVNFSMWVNILTSILNIILDWYLIGYLSFGIEAAAFATAISMTCGTFLSLIPFIRKKITLKFSKPSISLKEFLEIIYNGSSEFFGNIAGSIMSILVNGFLITLGGAAAVSAYSIVMYIDSIFRFVLFGMTESLQPVISYNAGMKNNKRILSLLKINSIYSFTISAISMILMLVFNKELSGIFTSSSNSDVLEITRNAIILFAPSYMFSWFVLIVSSLLTSIDKPKESFIIMLFNSIIFPLIVLIISTRILGLYGVFITETITEILSFTLCLIIIHKFKRIFKS